MLVIVENWDIHDLLELVLDVEAVGALDILEIDATKGGTKCLYNIDELVWIGRVYTQIDAIHLGEFLEKYGLSLHDGLTCECSDVAKT